MRKIEISSTCVSANSAGFASAVTGGAWALSVTRPGDHLAHQVTIHNNTANDHSATTATIVGTGADGEVLFETLHLPDSSSTVTSVNYYASLTSVTPGASIGVDTMSIGWAVAAVSAWHPCALGVQVFTVGFGCSVQSGTPTYTVQHSYGDGIGFNHATVVEQTVNSSGSYGSPVAAIRLLFGAAGGVSLAAIQVGA